MSETIERFEPWLIRRFKNATSALALFIEPGDEARYQPVETEPSHVEMVSNPYGRYVRYTDLVALQAENEKLKAERDDYKAGMEFFEDRQEARLRVVGRCAECGKDIYADGSRTVENRGDSPEWHSWCYGRVQRARVTLLEDAIREWKKASEKVDMATAQFRDNNLSWPDQLVDAEWEWGEAEAILKALVVDPPTLQGDK